jgi:hypothetical protein
VHKGFNLQLRSTQDWLQWKPAGDALFKSGERKFQSSVEAYVESGVIDGGKLQSHWFGQEKVDVFISHSHKDKELAIAIAGWLHDRFGLRAFVDSCVWGYANDLQRLLDNKYCKSPPPATTYAYDKRNRTTSHVHMMLSTALIDMIDRTECFVFLHTNESIVKNDIQTTVKHATTTSPWIYAELAASRVIRQQPTGREKETVLGKALESGAMASMPIEHPAHLAHLNAIDDGSLKVWGRSGKRKLEALDKLYELFG